jgi:hypothetical protein
MLKKYFGLFLLLPTAGLLAAEFTAVTETTALEAENSWCRAFLTGDADAIAAIEREDYTLTNSRGACQAGRTTSRMQKAVRCITPYLRTTT